ncbi:MAG: hypothetical protein KIT84_13775 [Labilithrix sp.]|nr:hypothetical protein [Labilithrix sp.]MCW5812088.1 hypothetical protein [Labilithrix sp.]
MDNSVQPPPSIVGAAPVPVATARTRRLWGGPSSSSIRRTLVPLVSTFRTKAIAPASGAPLLVEVVDDADEPDVLVDEEPVLVLVLDALPASGDGSAGSVS